MKTSSIYPQSHVYIVITHLPMFIINKGFYLMQWKSELAFLYFVSDRCFVKISHQASIHVFPQYPSMNVAVGLNFNPELCLLT